MEHIPDEAYDELIRYHQHFNDAVEALPGGPNPQDDENRRHHFDIMALDEPGAVSSGGFSNPHDTAQKQIASEHPHWGTTTESDFLKQYGISHKNKQFTPQMDNESWQDSIETGEPMNITWRLLKEDDEVPDPRRFTAPQEDYVEMLRERAAKIKRIQEEQDKLFEEAKNVPIGLRQKHPGEQSPGTHPAAPELHPNRQYFPTTNTHRDATEGIGRRVNPYTETGTFEGLPFEPSTHFTRSEPMEIAFQLLKRQTTLSAFDERQIQESIKPQNSNIFIAAKPGLDEEGLPLESHQMPSKRELSQLSDNMLAEIAALKEKHGNFGITSATGNAAWDLEPSFMLTNVPQSARNEINNIAEKYRQQSIGVSEKEQEGVDFVTPQGVMGDRFTGMAFEKDPMYSTDFPTGQRLTFNY
tara:strand:- start:3585 stop:4823 length:1239 start_codon:yes stop_codon:yes gene_type:complete